MRRGRKDALGSARWKSREPGRASRGSREAFQALPAPGHGVGEGRVVHPAVVLVWGHDTWGDRRGHLAPRHTQGLPWLWAPPQGHGWRKGTLLPIQILLAGSHTVPVGCSVENTRGAGAEGGTSSGWWTQAPHPEGILKGTFRSWNPRVAWVALELIRFHTPATGRGSFHETRWLQSSAFHPIPTAEVPLMW